MARDLGRRRRGGEAGFTLIELLVVIAILSVLAAIVVVNVIGVKSSGLTAACRTDTQTIQTAVDDYYNDGHGPGGADVFPDGTTVSSGTDTATPAAGDLVDIAELLAGSPPYLSTEPGNGESFEYTGTGGNVEGYLPGSPSPTAC
jgi:prepilin-type N-terminal cleavage/methylation domain-containing protein